MTDTDDLIDEDLQPRAVWQQALVWLATPVFFVLLWFALGWIRAPALPDAAPAFTLTTATGEPITLEQFRGRTVVLNFWATWCGPCKLESPSFAAFARNHPEIAVLGMAADQDPRLVQRAGTQMDLPYPLVMTDRKTLQAYGISTFPTTVIVGPDGAVRTAHTGMLFRPQLWALLKL